MFILFQPDSSFDMVRITPLVSGRRRNGKYPAQRVLAAFVLFILLIMINRVEAQMTALTCQNPEQITRPVSYPEMEAWLTGLNQADFITVQAEGRSHQNRTVFSVRLYRGKNEPAYRLLLYAQQHGNEPAGKDALLFLLRQFSENPRLLPADLELWLMPMLNPDGAQADTRRNAVGADLNRDHLTLDQPETRALYQVVRRVNPHIAIDCHEFVRDSEDYTAKGWLEWPQIMMDTANNPLFHPDIYRMGTEWCAKIARPLATENINYTRYYVGGVPPEEEQRFSAPDMDDARNGIAGYGGLSFIIESGVRRSAPDPNADLGTRVQAYQAIFTEFIFNKSLIKKSLQVLKEIGQNQALPEFIPTNYFWANRDFKISGVQVIETGTNSIRTVSTANFMTDLVCKNSIAPAAAYLVEAKNAEPFKILLDRQAVKYQVLEQDSSFTSGTARLIRFEDFTDSVYNRYADRAIVSPLPEEIKTYAPGSLLIPVQGSSARRIILLLEPNQMYGLYQYPQYRQLIDSAGILPVHRLLSKGKCTIY